MSLFVSPCSNTLWRIVHPLRNMMSWVVPISTSKQYAAPKGVAPKPNHLALPFSESHKDTQANPPLKSSFKSRISKEDLQQINIRHPVANLDKRTPTSRMQPRHLRVFREHDLNVAPNCAGRMVISGRMKDVCAEIDRLVKAKE